MDIQDRYDELDNIVRTLDNLIDEITDEDYIDIFNNIKCEAQDEMEELEEKIRKEEEQEERKMNADFERSRL